MDCRNHAGTAAVDRCTGCAEPFCFNCLVELAGQKYCGSCKVLALQGRTIVLEKEMHPCPEAGEALTLALVSIIPCIGFIFAIFAMVKAVHARKAIEANPQLSGWGKANAALV